MEEKRRLSRVEVNHQREKKKRVSRWIKYIIGIIFLFACIYVTAVYLKTKNAFDKTCLLYTSDAADDVIDV